MEGSRRSLLLHLAVVAAPLPALAAEPGFVVARRIGGRDGRDYDLLTRAEPRPIDVVGAWNNGDGPLRYGLARAGEVEPSLGSVRSGPGAGGRCLDATPFEGARASFLMFDDGKVWIEREGRRSEVLADRVRNAALAEGADGAVHVLAASLDRLTLVTLDRDLVRRGVRTVPLPGEVLASPTVVSARRVAYEAGAPVFAVDRNAIGLRRESWLARAAADGLRLEPSAA